MNNLIAVLCIVTSYFIGNISPAILISKAKGTDIREEGSGNAGSTNMLRVYGRKAAAATLLIDVLKGVAAVSLGAYLGGQTVSFICADAVVIGHIWPVLYGLRGGKGIATGFGALLAISPPVGGFAAAIALSVIAITKKVSAGSLLAACSVPFFVWRFVPSFLPYALFLIILILIKHKSNILRIIKGQEPKIKL